eukprot:2231717-Rhodomonas_salina.1
MLTLASRAVPHCTDWTVRGLVQWSTVVWCTRKGSRARGSLGPFVGIRQPKLASDTDVHRYWPGQGLPMTVHVYIPAKGPQIQQQNKNK